MSSDPSGGLSPDDALPPVEPPTAGFIVQLFVVPGVIVVVIVMIWVLFNWLAQKGNDRDAYVRDLKRNTEARWQAAFNLAQALRSERQAKSPELAVDHQLAKQLAGILRTELDEASMTDNSLAVRVYLCRALGEFQVADGLPMLVEAAGTVRDEKEREVRRAALEGIALLAANAGADSPQFQENSQLDEVLLDAASDDDPHARSVAAVALGVIGSPRMLDKLRFMVEDGDPNVRYNAATRLAQQGDVAALPVLLEMLDPTETAGIDIETEEALRPFKRAVITINALRAGEQLANTNPDADLSELEEAVQTLLAGDTPGEIRLKARALANALARRTAGAAK